MCVYHLEEVVRCSAGTRSERGDFWGVFAAHTPRCEILTVFYFCWTFGMCNFSLTG